jgi:hypothetical protein
MNNFSDLVGKFLEIIGLIIPLLFGLTLVVISWKIIDAWIINGGEQSKIDEGKHTVVVGIIALVVMSGIWGILGILQRSLLPLP